MCGELGKVLLESSEERPELLANIQQYHSRYTYNSRYTYKNGLGCYYNQSIWALGYNGCSTQVGTLSGLVQFCVLTATQGERVELRDILNNSLD